VAQVLTKFTDGEAHLIGTIKFTNVDATNRYYLSEGMELLKNADRGSWCLVQAFHKHLDYEKLQNQHSTNMHCQGSSFNAAMSIIPPLNNPAKNCGYIVFKDSRLVLFYTNDLVEDPPEPTLMTWWRILLSQYYLVLMEEPSNVYMDWQNCPIGLVLTY